MTTLSYEIAEDKDIKSIIQIFRRCFPNSIKWRMKYYSRLWLKYLICSDSCEIWLAKKNAKTLGLLMLVSDYRSFNRLKNKFSLWIYLVFNLIIHPDISLYFKKLKAKNCSGKKNTCLTFTIDDKDGHGSISVEQLAVIPDEQGKGYGSLLIEFAKARAAYLGFKRISLLVNMDNSIAYHLYKKHGFQ